MNRLPIYFWEDEQNHKRYIQWLGRELGVEKMEDWYKVTIQDFYDRRGERFLEYYENSYTKALQTHFPKFDWKPWLFRQAPSGYWHDLENCRKYVKWFEKQSGFKSKKDWYEIRQDDIYALQGSGMLNHFACSVQQLVSAIYPDHDWKPWLFTQVTKNFWPQNENRIAYMQWLEKKLRYKKPNDWYRITKLDFIHNQGASLMQMGYKPIALIRELYPDQEWLQWRFIQVSQGYWKEKANRIAYLKWLKLQLGYRSTDDWFKIKNQDFAHHFGGTMLTDIYGGDVALALKELHPEREWHAWHFHKVTAGFWDDTVNCRKYLEWLADQLGFKKETDWYRVRLEDFRERSGTAFIHRFKTPYKSLTIAFPNYDWLPWMFENVPFGFWDQTENRNWYFRWLGAQLGFNRPEQWQRLTVKQLREHRGDRLLPKMKLIEIRAEGELHAKKLQSPGCLN